MKRYLLDTGIASDYVNRRRGVYEQSREARARGDRIGTTTPVLGELWYGRRKSLDRSSAFANCHRDHESCGAILGAGPVGKVTLQALGRQRNRTGISIDAVLEPFELALA